MGRLRLLGMDLLKEPMDLLFENEAALEALAERLVATGCPVFLERVPTDSPTLAVLRRAYSGRGIVVERPAGPYPYIVLSDSWTHPEQHLNSRRRSALRRMRRKAEKKGDVSVDVLQPSLQELPFLLEEAYRIEAAGWKGRRGTALATRETLGRFFRKYAVIACAEGTLRLAFLRIKGRGAAMQYAAEHAGSFWLLKIGYDEAYRDCSPGNLLMAETIRYAAEKGLHTYEFLGQAEDWARVWTEQQREFIGIWAYPWTLRGVLALVHDAWGAGSRRLRRQWREGR
jgi:CelD/BcsL family acetyltransferase involved in cellulose biosynthesis